MHRIHQSSLLSSPARWPPIFNAHETRLDLYRFLTQLRISLGIILVPLYALKDKEYAWLFAKRGQSLYAWRLDRDLIFDAGYRENSLCPSAYFTYVVALIDLRVVVFFGFGCLLLGFSLLYEPLFSRDHIDTGLVYIRIIITPLFLLPVKNTTGIPHCP